MPGLARRFFCSFLSAGFLEAGFFLAPIFSAHTHEPLVNA